MMLSRQVLLLAALPTLLAACSSYRPPAADVYRPEARPETTSDGTSTAVTLAGYKDDIAQRISATNSTKVYVGAPQALLRSVVVLKFVIDASGTLLRSEVLRSNRDSATEATALASLRATAPFPKPATHLLRNGRIEISETWLFNNDGRFQIRSIAQPQMKE